MAILQRHFRNPVLKPDESNLWENFAVFNGSVLKENNEYHLFYRAMGEEKMIDGKKLRLSVIGKARSSNGLDFADRKIYIQPEYDWEKYGCEDPRVTKIGNQYFIFYTALSDFPPNHQSIKVAVAFSDNLDKITEKHLVTPFNAKAMTIFPEKINNQYLVFLTVNTDKPPAKIAYARFENISELWNPDFWNEWYENLDDHVLNIKRISSDQVEIGAPPIKTPQGWLLIHSYIKNYFTDEKVFRIEALLLDLNDPTHVIGRIEQPCLIPEEHYELEGQIKNVIFPEGALIEENKIKIYYGAADNYCCVASDDVNDFMQRFEINCPTAIKCQKFDNNPLLQPIPEHDWESQGVFNPATVYLDGKIYLIYRALSKDSVSSFGCAVSNDGIFIDERLDEPVYIPRTKWEISDNHGSGYGCEDPRITALDDKLYMCYTAYDGKLPRIALTNISITNFLKRDWSSWSEPIIISSKDIADKDACLFPEKINNQYVFFHRVEPNIIIDFVDDLEFGNNKTLDCHNYIYPGSKLWDGIKIGINTPPLKTPAGWLTFYHGISQTDHHYRVGAFLSDLHDVTKVIARTPYPILEPETYFEKEGIVGNVVFPCGYVVVNDNIYLYYGGADKVVCGARINLNDLVNYLVRSMTKKYLTINSSKL